MTTMPELKIADNTQVIYDTITDQIKGHAIENGELSILEAGCGRRWPFDLEDVHFTLTGIDCDQDALNARKSVVNDLDEAILGDLRTADLPNSKFDIVYCSYVLEHIIGAEAVLSKFLR